MSLPRKRVAKAVLAVSQNATAARNDPDEEEEEVLPWNELIWLGKKIVQTFGLQR